MSVLVALLITLLARAAALPQGGDSISGACGTMTPAHRSNPQTSPPPYRLIPSTTVSTAQPIQLSISPQNGTYFRGFMLQVRMNGSDTALGSFVNIPPATAAICNGTVLVHSSPSSPWNTTLSVGWLPPTTPSISTYQIFATVVQEMSVFWAKIAGPRLTVLPLSSPLPTDNTTTASTVVQPTTLEGGLPPFSSRDCGSSKGCFTNPVCLSDPCQHFFSWQVSGMTIAQQFDMELGCVGFGWCAVGMSFDQAMGNDYVIMALQNASGQWVVQNRFNRANDNNAVDNSQTTMGLSNIAVSYSDGQVRARFTRSETVSGGGNQVFNLNRPYYLFLANGPMDSGQVLIHQTSPSMSLRTTTFYGKVLTDSSSATRLVSCVAQAAVIMVATYWTTN